MSYELRAVIAHANLARNGRYDARPVPVARRVNCEAAGTALNGRALAYVEAEYFGGTGDQHAIGWRDGRATSDIALRHKWLCIDAGAMTTRKAHAA